eukprot:scaffold1272_cov250-Pinguiococcus_pyrenoidosus.AAC.74
MAPQGNPMPQLRLCAGSMLHQRSLKLQAALLYRKVQGQGQGGRGGHSQGVQQEGHSHPHAHALLQAQDVEAEVQPAVRAQGGA